MEAILVTRDGHVVQGRGKDIPQHVHDMVTLQLVHGMDMKMMTGAPVDPAMQVQPDPVAQLDPAAPVQPDPVVIVTKRKMTIGDTAKVPSRLIGVTVLHDPTGP